MYSLHLRGGVISQEVVYILNKLKSEIALAKSAVEKSKQMVKEQSFKTYIPSLLYWLGLIFATLALTEASEYLKSYSYSLVRNSYPVKSPIMLITYIIMALVLIGSSKVSIFTYSGWGWKADSQTGKLKLSRESLDTNILLGLVFFGWFVEATWISLGFQIEAVLALNDLDSEWIDYLIFIVVSLLVILTHAFANLTLAVQQIKSFGLPQTIAVAFKLWYRHLPALICITAVYLFWDFISLFTGLLLQIWLFPRKYGAYYLLTESFLEM